MAGNKRMKLDDVISVMRKYGPLDEGRHEEVMGRIRVYNPVSKGVKKRVNNPASKSLGPNFLRVESDEYTLDVNFTLYSDKSVCLSKVSTSYLFRLEGDLIKSLAGVIAEKNCIGMAFSEEDHTARYYSDLGKTSNTDELGRSISNVINAKYELNIAQRDLGNKLYDLLFSTPKCCKDKS